MLVGKTIFKQYKIIKQISAGAFGQTYRVKDLAFPGEPYRVLKHLCPLNQDPESLTITKRLFKTEAQCLANLGEYDCIPRLYSYFEEDGEFFLVQDLIEGQDLTGEFQSGKRWNEDDTVQFLQELLELVSLAHKQNTIHRDIKPANIMRRYSDRKLVLIDFGAVKEILTVDRNGQTHFTPTIVIGTPGYMPPEQAIGKPGKYSDVYAVGMLGIQALTGLPSMELPQDSEQLEQIWNNHDIQIDPQLKSVLEKMVSFQYKQRYRDAEEALKALFPKIIKPSKTKIEGASKFKDKIKQSLIFWGAIALGSTVLVSSRLFNQPNYKQLETYLQNQEWKQANTETNKIILKLVGENSTLDSKSSNNLSCKALKTIDSLWTENSNERFGFTPQKKVYLETDNQFNKYVESTYEAFGNRVGWRIFGTWKRYEDVNFEQLNPEITPLGYLPLPEKIAENKQDLRIREPGIILSRFNACGF